jgi:serine O-acetyltransferase
LQAHRLSHFWWRQGARDMALYWQSRIAAQFAVDIHPAARIGQGVTLDHATGFVAGATCQIENDVSLLQNVTLGGRGREQDRHPKVRRGATIGAGACILGNVEIGAGARVGAGAVVLNNVLPFTTVVGVPAKAVRVDMISC